MLSFIKNMKISRKFFLLGSVIVIGFSLYGIFSYQTLTLVKVNGPLYKNIVAGKDLIADILPPPEYLVEANLVAHQMVNETNKEKLQALVNKGKQLREDFETRHHYWENELSAGKTKDIMIETAYTPAIRFLDLRDNQFVPALLKGDMKGANALLNGPMAQAYEMHRAAIDQVVELANAQNAADEANTAGIIDARTIALVSLAFGVIALAALLSFVIARGIAQPVKAVVASIDNADLNSQFQSDRKDEIGDLQRSFDRFVTSIRETLLHVAESSTAVASASSQISSSTEELAAGAQEQTSQSGEVASAVEEMTKTIVENSRNASTTADVAKQARQTAEEGGKVVEETIKGMKKIADVVGKSAETVKALGNSSNQIGEIVEVIDDIADQTNLLALNAAIEAARAGDQGRGFAVVADEVRKLAERTSRATKEIGAMIKQIQSDTAAAVTSMQEGTAHVDTGIRLADQAGTSLQDIVIGIQQLTDMVGQIAAASEQQSSASEQISKNVEAISAVTSQAAQGTQQIASAAEDLNRLTETLQNLLSRFKLNSSSTAIQPRARRTSTPLSDVTVQPDGHVVLQEQEA
jgi:methyl-accepting chemotaxis protein